MLASISYPLLSIAALSIGDLSGVVAVTRECITTVRVTAYQGLMGNFPEDDVSVDIEVTGKGNGKTSRRARKNAQEGLNQCLENYFEWHETFPSMGWVDLDNCNMDDACSLTMFPDNSSLEELIIEKLFVEKLGCDQGQFKCRDDKGFIGGVGYRIVSSRSPVGGSGCKYNPSDEESPNKSRFTIKDRMCGGGRGGDGDRCTNQLEWWCTGGAWHY